MQRARQPRAAAAAAVVAMASAVATIAMASSALAIAATAVGWVVTAVITAAAVPSSACSLDGCLDGALWHRWRRWRRSRHWRRRPARDAPRPPATSTVLAAVMAGGRGRWRRRRYHGPCGVKRGSKVEVAATVALPWALPFPQRRLRQTIEALVTTPCHRYRNHNTTPAGRIAVRGGRLREWGWGCQDTADRWRFEPPSGPIAIPVSPPALPLDVRCGRGTPRDGGEPRRGGEARPPVGRYSWYASSSNSS